MDKALFLLCAFLVFSSGCMYEGPGVTSSEVAEQKARLQAKALLYKIQLLNRVQNVGFRIVKALPKRFARGAFPYLGLVVIEDDESSSLAYGTPGAGAPLAVGVIKGSSVENLDFMRGSLIYYVDKWKVSSPEAYYQALKRVYSRGMSGVEIGFWHPSQGGCHRYARLEEVPLDVKFAMSSDADINSMATPNAVIVTYGMMKFISSDDELAVVLGHELAHIVLGHHMRTSSLGIFSSLISSMVGSAVESKAPGLGSLAGDVAGGAMSGYFSREMERQADYWGLYFAYRAGYDIRAGIEVWERFAIEVPESLTRDFFATHPSSVERRVYIEKIVNQLEHGEFPR